jgi:HD-GYP domain-containing protein (c-di-GMP phosphodiesterase class II)
MQPNPSNESKDLTEDAEDIMARAEPESQSADPDTALRDATPSQFSAQARVLCEAFGRAVDLRDGHRIGHSRDAAYYACLVAQEMDLPIAEVEQIEMAALLNGIGKLSVPDTLLNKRGALSQHELNEVRDAIIAGASLVRAVPGFENVAELVRHQGERWDGTGSPDGLLKEEIPLGARILAVALRFAAMTRPRADRPALSVVSGALEFLAYEAGIALDPTVVRTFLSLMGREYSNEQ